MKIPSAILAGFLILTAAPLEALEAPAPPTKKELAAYAGARATITTKFGKIVLRFFPELAPMHVKNFVALAESGFYDTTTFHRTVPGLLIQGGDPRGNGTGGPGYSIRAEFSDKKHVAGILSMARMKDHDSAGSQFFILVGPAPHLDGKYSVFGQVAEGLEVAGAIAGLARGRMDKPLETVTMKVEISY